MKNNRDNFATEHSTEQNGRRGEKKLFYVYYQKKEEE